MYFSIPSFCSPPQRRIQHGQTRPSRHLAGDATLAGMTRSPVDFQRKSWFFGWLFSRRIYIAIGKPFEHEFIALFQSVLVVR